MKKLMIGGKIESGNIGAGCMRIRELPLYEVEDFIAACLESGIDLFDHADVYGAGDCESLFGQALKVHPDWRAQMTIQTKCGIGIPHGRFDFSFDHIISAAEGSLKRLGVETVDILLLHRPDTLMEPEEVAEAFNRL